LTLYGAVAKGVSRIHAAIYGSESALQIVDMDSRNGTYLNGRRLAPDVPHILRDGDHIRLGKLIISLHF
jgi:pSer/pThr/pTyr-binding forkhead associated (FHA) protein